MGRPSVDGWLVNDVLPSQGRRRRTRTLSEDVANTKNEYVLNRSLDVVDAIENLVLKKNQRKVRLRLRRPNLNIL
jgi:hypothetical protein